MFPIDANGEWKNNLLNMPFVWCPAGAFKMGSPADEKGRGNDETRVDVKLTRGFWIAKYEVTQRDWKNLNRSLQPAINADPAKENHPVTEVPWDEAMAFCQKLTDQERDQGRIPDEWKFSLPTEAQWEYACRAGTQDAYYFGKRESGLRENAWYRVNSGDATHPVGEKPPNQFGLHDMYGNVFEWCRDSYVEALPGGSDPEVTIENGRKVRRGGNFNSPAIWCRSAHRGSGRQAGGGDRIGFRIAIVAVD
jgi:formylglycine-generating enzyme required for sulfatase activity